MSSDKNAVHPGVFLKAMVLDINGLTVTDAAQALGVTRPALSALINCRSALSSDMAVRIEQVFGISLERLMRMQTDCDIARARRRQGEFALPPYRSTGLH